MSDHESLKLLLPATVVGSVDVGRLFNEVQVIDEFLNQAEIRRPGKSTELPKITRITEEITEMNSLNLLIGENRKQLMNFLINVKEKSPQIHLSFSAEPTPLFLQKITTYIRKEIHPYALLQIGLQPTIGAGFMLRTTNKYYDFSLRTTLRDKRDLLIKKIRENAMIIESTPAEQDSP